MHKIGHGGTHFTSWATQLRTASTYARIKSIAYSPSARRLVVAVGVRILVLNAASLEKERDISTPHDIQAVCFVGSDDMIATASDDGSARMWHVASATETKTLVPSTRGAAACSLAFGADGQPLLAVGYADGTVRLWRLSGGDCATLHGHSSAVTGVALSRDGRIAATASRDGSAKLWRVADAFTSSHASADATTDGGAEGGAGCMATLRLPPKSGLCSHLLFGAARTSSMVVVATGSGAAYAFDIAAASASASAAAPGRGRAQAKGNAPRAAVDASSGFQRALQDSPLQDKPLSDRTASCRPNRWRRNQG